MKNSSLYTKSIDASLTRVKVEIMHEDKPGYFTIFGTLSFDRVSYDLSVSWSYDCPLSRIERLKLCLWFVKFLLELD